MERTIKRLEIECAVLNQKNNCKKDCCCSKCYIKKSLQAIKDLKDCRNELCILCGKYKEMHLGACQGCRWE